MDLITCKCSRVCKPLKCQCFANAPMCSSACKNQLCDNIIDDDFKESGDDTADGDECNYDDDDNLKETDFLHTVGVG